MNSVYSRDSCGIRIINCGICVRLLLDVPIHSSVCVSVALFQDSIASVLGSQLVKFTSTRSVGGALLKNIPSFTAIKAGVVIIISMQSMTFKNRLFFCFCGAAVIISISCSKI